MTFISNKARTISETLSRTSYETDSQANHRRWLHATEVMERLKIPPRSFQRYYHEAFAPEREILATRLTDDEVLNQLAILEGGLTQSRRYVVLLLLECLLQIQSCYYLHLKSFQT